MRTRTLDGTQFGAFAEHRNLQPASCSFLQALKCAQICSRPRRTGSLSTRFLMWKLTVVSEIDEDEQVLRHRGKPSHCQAALQRELVRKSCGFITFYSYVLSLEYPQALSSSI
jgi:hypothetical protein